MKEMIYQESLNYHEVLFDGEFRGRRFKIISLGTHPVAYVELSSEEEEFIFFLYFDIKVHGRIKWHGRMPEKLKDSDNFWVGWSYNHYGDYRYDIGNVKARKYTTEKVFKDVKRVIEQLNSKKIHTLKEVKKYYEAKESGKKLFTVRINDRGFKVGDYISFVEISNGELTGRSLGAKITYILDDLEGLKDGYVMIGLKLDAWLL